MEALQHSKYSYADYLHWEEEERWELIYGIPHSMSPAPSRQHQEVVGELFFQIKNHLKNKKHQVYVAPFDVRLANDFSDDHLIDTVVQPDISIFCDPSRLDEKGAVGAPDWIIEVLSPATRDKDLNTKLLLYQKFGVKEYWIVDIEKSNILTYTLDETGKYPQAIRYSHESIKLKSNVLKSFAIDMRQLFGKV